MMCVLCVVLIVEHHGNVIPLVTTVQRRTVSGVLDIQNAYTEGGDT
jgi:hypothetical protein